MDCAMCGYRWCWSCGMSLENPLHNAFVPFCEVSTSFMNKKSGMCCGLVLMYLAYVNFPVLMLLVMIIGTFYATYECTRHLNKKNLYRDSNTRNCCGVKNVLLRKCCKLMVTITIVPFLFILNLILAILFYALFVFIFWGIYTIFIFLMFYNWFPEGLLTKIFYCRCKLKKSKP